MMEQIATTVRQYESIAKAKDADYRESVRFLVADPAGAGETEDLQKEVKDQMLANQQLENQLLKIQDTFAKSKNGIGKLAAALYGKLTAQTIAGAKASPLSCALDKKNKNFKTLHVVLRDNFLILFKSATDSAPLEVILVTKPPQACVDERIGRQHCFMVEGHAFCAASEQLKDEWVLALTNPPKWYESSVNQA